MKLAWGAKVSRDFALRVIAIAVGFDPSWLMACMYFESRLNPAAKNPGSSATGLIQFMRSTAESLGTTVEALAAMTAEEQLNFVAAYMAPYAPRIRSLSDCYMAILWPAAVGKPDDAIIFPPGSQAFLANRGLDLDHDGAVTKAEATSRVAALLAEGLQDGNVADVEAETPAQGGLTMPDIGTAIAGVATAFNPLLGLGVTLVNTLIDAFSPLAKEKITRELGRHGADPTVSSQFADTLLGAAKKLTGKDDAMDAVVAARQDPTVLAQLETNALDRLKELAPLLDKLAEYDTQEWEAEESSKDRAAARNSGEAYDMSRTLVWGALLMVAWLVFFLCAIAAFQTIKNGTPDAMVWAAITGIIGFATGVLSTIYAYRFGSSRSSGAKDVTIREMSRR